VACHRHAGWNFDGIIPIQAGDRCDEAMGRTEGIRRFVRETFTGIAAVRTNPIQIESFQIKSCLESSDSKMKALRSRINSIQFKSIQIK
jgi:hypothetical protein